jgi:hypothetical protein
MNNDSTYYAELELGAVYAAEKASDEADRAKHLRMARIYGGRAREAAGLPVRTYH